MSEITQASGVGTVNSVARYLDILQHMRLITRRVPATEKQPEKSKKGRYRIDDHFLRFWFRYIHPNQSQFDLGLKDAIFEQRILPDMDHFAATAFETAAQGFVANLARSGKLTFLPDRVGAWWDREAEIDVLAVSHAEKTALVGECKWSKNALGTNILDDLKYKAQILMDKTEFKNVHYALFARTGFTPALEALAKAEGVGLFTVKSLVKRL